MRTFILLFLTGFLIGCGASENSNVAVVNTNPANTNAAPTSANNPLATTKTPEISTADNAPTLAPVVQRYYQALKGKDDAALRKIYSQATLKSLEADMKDEKQTSLAKFITDLEPVPDAPFTVRNEQIQGDTAIAEMRGGSYPNGIKIKFVKENGEWKMTNESPEVQSVKQSTSNSNSNSAK